MRRPCDTQLEAFLTRGWHMLPTVGEILELMLRHERQGFKELTMAPLKSLDASERRRLQEYRKTASKKAPATVAVVPADMQTEDGGDDDGGESARSDDDDNDDLLAICRSDDDDVAHE